MIIYGVCFLRMSRTKALLLGKSGAFVRDILKKRGKIDAKASPEGSELGSGGWRRRCLCLCLFFEDVSNEKTTLGQKWSFRSIHLSTRFLTKLIKNRKYNKKLDWRGSQNGAKSDQKWTSKNRYFSRPLKIDFFRNLGPKMEAQDPLESTLFWREEFSRFLKDVLNKTLTFELRRDPKMEPLSFKKALKFKLP